MEGKSTAIIRSSGEKDSVKMVTAGSTIELKAEEISKLTLQKVIELIDNAALEIAKQKERLAIDTLNEVTNKTGNIVSGAGKPLSADNIIEVMEKISLDFNAKGEAEWSTIVVHPDMGDALKRAIDVLDTEPTTKQRLEAVLLKKREEWRGREASRKLVG